MKFGTFNFGTGVLFGSGGATESQLPNLVWLIEIDWDGDGVYNGENEATRCNAFNMQRGRRNIISGQRLQHYPPGKAQFTLDNSDGRYDYFNTSSPIYPNVKPGKFVKIRVKDVSAGLTYNIIHGQITEIFPFQQGGVKKCRLTVEDGLRWLSNQTIKTNVVSSSQYDNIVWNTILTEVGWPTTYWGNLGNRTTKATSWWWAWDVNALEAINGLEECTGGVFFHSRTGQAEFYGGNDTQLRATIDLDESEVLRDIAINQPWDIIRNQVVVKVHKKYLIANTDRLWQFPSDSDVAIPVDTKRYFEVTLTPDPGLAGADSFETAALVMDYSNPVDSINDDFQHFVDDTSGAGGIAYFDYVALVHKMSHGVIFSIDNFNGIEVYLQGWMAPSSVVNMTEAIYVTADDTNSQTEFGKRTLSIDVRDIESNVYAQELADWYLARFKDPGHYPVVQIENRPAKQFQPDLYTYKINFTAPSIGISAAQLFRIGGIEHNWITPNGAGVRTTFWLEPDFDLFSYT